MWFGEYLINDCIFDDQYLGQANNFIVRAIIPIIILNMNSLAPPMFFIVHQHLF